MPEDNKTETRIQPLLILSVQTRLVQTVSGTPSGDKSIFEVLSGSFEGAQLRGQVPAAGGDWVTRTPQGAQLDVRLLLQTDDGVTLLFRYAGRASQRDGQPRIEVAGRFEAPAGPYEWLNNTQAFGLGFAAPEGVRYHFYRFA